MVEVNKVFKKEKSNLIELYFKTFYFLFKKLILFDIFAFNVIHYKFTRI